MELLAFSEGVQLALVAALVTIVPSLIAFATLIVNLIAASRVKKVRSDLIRENKRNRRARAKAAAAVAEVHAETKALVKATNGMKDELVREVRNASFAAGVKSETDKGPHVAQTRVTGDEQQAQAQVIGDAIATAIDKNVETVKKDVKVVKSDVRAVKDEILKAQE